VDQHEDEVRDETDGEKHVEHLASGNPLLVPERRYRLSRAFPSGAPKIMFMDCLLSFVASSKAPAPSW
jgi:hypothetical protein